MITSVSFASFGTPSGDCTSSASGGDNNTFAVNTSCHAPQSLAALEAACVNQAHCMVAPACKNDECSVVDGA